jgi:hypothetical protein
VCKWDDFKTGLRSSSSRSESKGELVRKTEAFMKSLYQLPKRVRSYFNHAKVSYAAM